MSSKDHSVAANQSTGLTVPPTPPSASGPTKEEEQHISNHEQKATTTPEEKVVVEAKEATEDDAQALLGLFASTNEGNVTPAPATEKDATTSAAAPSDARASGSTEQASNPTLDSLLSLNNLPTPAESPAITDAARQEETAKILALLNNGHQSAPNMDPSADLDTLLQNGGGNANGNGNGNQQAPMAPVEFSDADASGKRKRKWSGKEEPRREAAAARHEIIKQAILDHMPAMQEAANSAGMLFSPSAVLPENNRLTTITCLYASVAQKSYGTEKRFLCPPPVVAIQGAHRHSMGDIPQGRISIFAEDSPVPISHHSESFTAQSLQATFKQLHISNVATAKSKHFNLRLRVAARGRSASDEQYFAEWDSPPINIISKPSKKSSKARNLATCIQASTLVSLYNRINSQTVRTKYLRTEGGRLCAKSHEWSPFLIQVMRNPELMEDGVVTDELPEPGEPVMYGSVVVLTDTITGVPSQPLIIRRVEKNVIVDDAVGPVSQMGKIAFESVREEGDENGERMFLSALGAQSDTGAARMETVDPTVGWQPPKAGSTTRVEDHVCWTIVGISQFRHTFLDAFGQPDEAPIPMPGQAPALLQAGQPMPNIIQTPAGPMVDDYKGPVTPFPALATNPAYLSNTHTLELVVGDFVSTNPAIPTPEVWLGHVGPLNVRVSAAPAEYPNTVMLHVELPSFKDLNGGSMPLLFVRHDGVVSNPGCEVVVDYKEGEGEGGEEAKEAEEEIAEEA
ncbi:hypothetical protein YB2330_004217 [Saitoella coloradoensis]